MEAKDLNLLQMPEVVMGHILDKLDIPDILTLRKTCHHFRNLIDDLHPDPKIVSTVIKVDPDSIEFKLNFGQSDGLYPDGKLLRIKYGFVECAPDLCTVQWFRSDGVREFYFEDGDFIALFCRDFYSIFGGHSFFEFFRKPNNPSIIQDFTLNLEYFPDDHVHWEAITCRLLSSLESTLQNRPRPLPVKEFNTSVFDKATVLQILPCFEPKTLEKISITMENGVEEKMRWWCLRGLRELEQWKSAKVLICPEIYLAKLREFDDFEEINVKLGKTGVREVLDLKESILNSTSKLKTGRIEIYTSNGERYFQDTYGFPFTDVDQFGDERKSWFFRFPNEKLFLQISFYPKHLRFDILERAPENARVIRE
ncbi:unnamed protein product [Caenorhabditis brenneri]